MKFTILLLLSILLFTFSASAQNPFSIKGAVVDTASNAKLVNTTISVLNAKDSTLVSFTRANSSGAFTLPNLKKGKLIMLVTYPGYADYVERFSLDSAKTTHDFGRLNMILKAKLLQDVIVKSTRAAMKIKGDTTEFDAKAFKVEPNAKVEDLLKQFPGIQVDKDGKITAQGQTVSKVLVDGEEFFGDDPTLVTKNLRADMVDKVQLYDKKSDQATFTGIDDGQKTKTLNIQLKADKKNGYFGKAEAQAGTDGYYQGQLLYNKFKAKEKFSAYGTLGNTGKTGLGWQDSQKYGAGGGMEVTDDGGMMFTISGGGEDEIEGWNGQYDQHGIPLARTGGLHYDAKFNNDKESINTNYKIGSLEVKGTSNTQTQTPSPLGSINTNSDQSFDKFIFRQKLDATYQVKLDTTSNLKIMVDGTFKNSKNKSNTGGKSFRNDTLINTNSANINNNNNTHIFDASAFYTKKFKKKGRTISVLVSEAINNSDTKGYLTTDAHFFAPKDSVAPHIDQYKTLKTNSNVVKTNITYTEPLSKATSVIFNYGLGVDEGTSDRRSYNASAPNVYNLLDSLYSNSFKLNQLSNQVGGFLNFKKNKLTVNFGTKVTNVNFDQTDQITGLELKRKFVNWNPQARFQYRFSQQKGLSLSYNGSPTQPSIEQIQPVVVNDNQVNFIIGNPLLKPSFTHNFSGDYNSYKVLSGMSVFMYGSYSLTTNPIVASQSINAGGQSVTQYVNLSNKGQSDFYFDGSINRKIAKADMYVGINGGVNGNANYNISNGELNFTKSYTYNIGLRASKYVPKKYDFNFNLGPTYTISGSSLTPQINSNGRGFNGYGSFTVFLPGKFQISSDGSYQFRAKTQTFDTDYHRTLINASLAKTFLKDDNLKFTLSGNDLLNQNQGFDRTANGNYIIQNTYTTIKRYFMFSISWDFNSMGGAAKK
ncbi:TonB-dependent receptor family protein [Mucilaginibacter sp. BJC16-A38]|uniref:TonB-dependent receptor n=1 Tax=Mucilaginibacter phenanthrenivorans TaxID=1234842 RepID=UPI00215737CD|nr:TonB-dependent receptor [Mucilaginibacter phenanthrenivorans]MCR8559027.1 TonB-dependent receptor family protein [Mucilaginibacter phenanthrenivorans]